MGLFYRMAPGSSLLFFLFHPSFRLILQNFTQLFSSLSQKKRSLKTQAPFFINNEISVLSDNKLLRSHAFCGVDFDEIYTCGEGFTVDL